jgi:hypothetical protein
MFEERAHPAARLAAWCRVHGATIVLGAVIGAGMATGGYALIVRSTGPTPQVAGSAAPVAPVAAELPAAEPPAAPRDTVVWRDETGAIFRAKVDPGDFQRLLEAQHRALDATRTESRDEASTEILAALKPIFAEMKDRVPGYADWYSSYATTYELVAQGLLSAFNYLGRSLDIFSPPQESLYATMAADMVEFLQEQYAEQVVLPQATQVRLQAAFDKSYGTLRAHWQRVIAGQRQVMQEFIQLAAGRPERLSPDRAVGVALDWDGQRDDRSVMHEDVSVEQSFRRGLLTVRLKLPRSGRPPAEIDNSDTSRVDADKIRGAIVTLFDKLVGTVISKMGSLGIGIFAGGTAGGTAGVGYGGMAALPGAAAAPGIAATVPIGALIGLATTIAAEMITNRLQASLTRREFEETLRQSVYATENAAETAMIAVLHEQVEAWYADIVPP